MSEVAASGGQRAPRTLLKVAIVALAAAIQLTWVAFLIWLVFRVI
jgi:hypothetical protein